MIDPEIMERLYDDVMYEFNVTIIKLGNELKIMIILLYLLIFALHMLFRRE